MSFYCLANPYSGTTEEMEQRVTLATKATYLLLKQGIDVMSLNAHNHIIKIRNDISKDESRKIFLGLAPNMIKESQGLIVLTLDGWKESGGVKLEIETAEKNNLPVFYLSMEEIENKSDKLKELV